MQEKQSEELIQLVPLLIQSQLQLIESQSISFKKSIPQLVKQTIINVPDLQLQQLMQKSDIKKTEEEQEILKESEKYLYTVYCMNKSGRKLLDKGIESRMLMEYYSPKELKITRELREIEHLKELQSSDRYIYTVYCKDLSGVTLLNKAFKDEDTAYSYAISKITNLLNIISLEFQDTKIKIMPLQATLIHINFKLENNDIVKYNYFKENYKNFFNYVSRDPIMFFVSKILLV